MKFAVTALMCASLAAPLAAQTSTQPTAAPSPQVPAMMLAPSAASTLVLPQGTIVRLRTLTALSSNDNRMGQRFDLETVDDVSLNGIVVIPRGSPAVGEVSMVKKKGMWGKSGRLQTSLISVRANGHEIALRGGTDNVKGDTGTAGVIASIAVVPIAGFFVTGTSAVLPMGTPASGMTVSDVPLVVAPIGTPVPQSSVLTAVPAASAVVATVATTPK